jgi:hypothetical protein
MEKTKPGAYARVSDTKDFLSMLIPDGNLAGMIWTD